MVRTDMELSPQFKLFHPLGVPVAAATIPSVIDTVCSWIGSGEKGRMVTFSTVHMIVEGMKDPAFLDLLKKSDLNCPDGMPLVWYGNLKLGKGIKRVCGPDFLPEFCAATEAMNLRHFFYGGAEGVAAGAAAELQRRHPGIQIAGAYSPPFRTLTPDEEEEVVQKIRAAKPDLIWVCLGCPKQELWIEKFRDRLDVPVLLAVGLAVDILAGSKTRAPYSMRVSGLEWLYRLFQEPKRLWKRYLVYNSIFLYMVLREALQKI
jgi:N-acetylglucosaminyldiphosphoundecaprenol N-acetyl-beta-D-mannosaminyltransferase